MPDSFIENFFLTMGNTGWEKNIASNILNNSPIESDQTYGIINSKKSVPDLFFKLKVYVANSINIIQQDAKPNERATPNTETKITKEENKKKRHRTVKFNGEHKPRGIGKIFDSSMSDLCKWYEEIVKVQDSDPDKKLKGVPKMVAKDLGLPFGTISLDHEAFDHYFELDSSHQFQIKPSDLSIPFNQFRTKVKNTYLSQKQSNEHKKRKIDYKASLKKLKEISKLKYIT